MPGIYLHIPFCKQACHYCDFHFTTSQRGRGEMLEAMLQELQFRKEAANRQTVDTIYFGGGTPSLLTYDELMRFFELIYTEYNVSADAEVTMEANPDDLEMGHLKELRRTPVNRFSIGIQSFREEDLRGMNRAHTAQQAMRCVPDAADAGFENISIDLIFGLPGLEPEHWQDNVERAFTLPITHLSCYGLTIEPKTALAWQIRKGLTPLPDEEKAAAQYAWLLNEAESKGFPWYEISNFSKPGYESRHNTAYWNGIPYIGIGPSAHSYDGSMRSWNVSNNAIYVKGIEKKQPEVESEVLNESEKFHEVLLTSLRVRTGLSLMTIRNRYDAVVLSRLLDAAQPFINKGWMILEEDHLRITQQGLLFADGITAELFII